MARNIVPLLSRTILFGSLAPDDLAKCAAAFRGRHFARGETLFLRGDPGMDLYLVECGRVRLAISSANGRRLSFQHAAEGDLFGEIGMLDGAPRTADAIAITRTKVHCLERSVFENLWMTRPELGRCVVMFLCCRLRQMTTQFEAVALHPLEVRLAQFLLSALPSPNTTPGKRIPLKLGFSQEELSQLIGASRPKVNAAMASLERAGALGRTADRLFCDPDKLARIAQRLSAYAEGTVAPGESRRTAGPSVAGTPPPTPTADRDSPAAASGCACR
jgi:CRP/FNR family cyclic AMP-dependent transcriptional regulator